MQEHCLSEWIIQSQKGDELAFGRIVSAFQPQMFAYVFRLVGNEDDAKDMVQETFIKAWTYCKSYNTTFRFSTWLYKIATHCCYDYLELRKRTTILPEDKIIALGDQWMHVDMEQQIMNKQIATLVVQLTHHLTPKQKLVFTLKYLEGLDTDEMIFITKLSAGKVKSNLYLAKKQIRETLHKIMSDEKR